MIEHSAAKTRHQIDALRRMFQRRRCAQRPVTEPARPSAGKAQRSPMLLSIAGGEWSETLWSDTQWSDTQIDAALDDD